jgi:chromosome segregation ATPase
MKDPVAELRAANATLDRKCADLAVRLGRLDREAAWRKRQLDIIALQVELLDERMRQYRCERDDAERRVVQLEAEISALLRRYPEPCQCHERKETQ